MTHRCDFGPAPRQVATALVAGLVVGLIAGCTPNEPQHTLLKVQAPSAIRQAQSAQRIALCEALNVRFTLVASSGAEAPAIDDAVLEPVVDTVCEWSFAGGQPVDAGQYNLVIRFETIAPNAACDAEPVLVGAYVVLDAAFPFTDAFPGFVDGLFFSGAALELETLPDIEGATREAVRASYEQGLVNLGYNFDPDEDTATNLTEVLVGSDPCVTSQPAELVVTSGDGVEGQAQQIGVQINRGDVSGDLGFRLQISHNNDLSESAHYATTEIQMLADGTDPDNVLMSPPLSQTPVRELWSVSIASTGDLSWEITFLPDEPFVGPLNLDWVLTDADGTVDLAPLESAIIDVPNIADSPRLLVNGVATTSFVFAEVPPPPDVVAPTSFTFDFEDDDLPASAALAISNWSPQVGVGPAGVTIAAAGAQWTLDWSPANDAVVTAPAGGITQAIEFVADSTVVDTADVLLEVAPLWNDAPLIDPPLLAQRLLPTTAFTQHFMGFNIIDPDRVAGTPSCTVGVTDSPCIAPPFTTVACVPAGPQVDGVWPFEIQLTADVDYFLNCGATPSIALSIMVTDVAPALASNAALSTDAWCVSPMLPGTCDVGDSSTELVLNSFDVVFPIEIAGGPAEPTAPYSGSSHALVHGPSRTALVEVSAANGDGVFLMDLNEPNPHFAWEVPAADMCRIHPGTLHEEVGAVDEVNHRIFAMGRREVAASCGERSALLLELGAIPPTVTSYDESVFCSNGFYAVTDSVGQFWVVCEADETVTRVAANGVLTTELVSDLRNSNSAIFNGDTLTGADGREWLIIQDGPLDGLVAMELGVGFDGVLGGLNTVRLGDGLFDGSRVMDHVVDASRNAYVFTVRVGTGILPMDLYRITADPTPTLEGPLALTRTHHGGLGNVRQLILREPAGEPTGEPDLIVYSNTGGGVPHVDLDSFTVVGERPAPDYSAGFDLSIQPSPDRRYYTRPVSSFPPNFTEGVLLYPWTVTAEILFVDMTAVPIEISTASASHRVNVSNAGHLTFITHGGLQVLYFPVAAAGND